MSIGERLKRIRKDLGLSQEKFANELSVHLRSYVSYEKDHRTLPQSILIRLLHMGYDIQWLLTGEGRMKLSGVTNDAEQPDYIVGEQIPLLKDLHQAFDPHGIPRFPFSSQKVSRPEENSDPFAYAVRISTLNDNSMIPFFSPDEIIIASPLDTLMNNDKAIIKLKDGRLLFRVIQYDKQDVRLMSANPDSPVFNISKSDILFAHKIVGSLKL